MGSCSSFKKLTYSDPKVLVQSQSTETLKKQTFSNVETFGREKIHVKVKFGNFIVLNESFMRNSSVRDLLNSAVEKLAASYKKARFDVYYKDQNITEKLNFILNDVIIENTQHFFLLVQVGHFPISFNTKENYITSNDYIGRLIIDKKNLEIILLDKIKLTITKKSLKNSFSEFEQIYWPSLKSAFCNGLNCLLVSGGEEVSYSEYFKTEQSEENSFSASMYCIKLDKLIIRRLVSMPEPKSMHSMLFVPNDFAVIIGGSNSVTCYCFNILTEKYSSLPNLNFSRSYSSLCLVNETFLYCFFGINDQNEILPTIERLNLRNNTCDWEIVRPNLHENAKGFKPQFFGTCLGKYNTQVVLLGNNVYQDVDENEVKNYLFDSTDDSVQNYFSSYFTFDKPLLEKFFIPLTQEVSVNIPLSRQAEFYYFYDDLLIHYSEDVDHDEKDHFAEVWNIISLAKGNKMRNVNTPVAIPNISNNNEEKGKEKKSKLMQEKIVKSFVDFEGVV